jgi:dephospho-CoA kinase
LPAARVAVLRVGLTGGVASGKSTVAALLAGHGAARLDADAVVADLYRSGQPCTLAIAARFGAGVLDPEGAVDRRALGAIVLAEGPARAWLEALVHPAVRREAAKWLQDLETSTHPPAVAVVEAALLVETGAWRDYDRLVVVTAPLSRRRARALAAGWSPEQLERTVDAQISDIERQRVASDVIENDGDLPALACTVDALWQQLRAAASALDGPGSGLTPAT